MEGFLDVQLQHLPYFNLWGITWSQRTDENTYKSSNGERERERERGKPNYREREREREMIEKESERERER